MMKFSLVSLALLASSASAFAPAATCRPVATTQLSMFGGAGAGSAMEDDPEAQAQIEQAAKAMNMSVDEYKLGMRARAKLAEELNDARVEGGVADKVLVNRDANNPPQFLQISISESAKAAGQARILKSGVVTVIEGKQANITKQSQTSSVNGGGKFKALSWGHSEFNQFLSTCSTEG